LIPTKKPPRVLQASQRRAHEHEAIRLANRQRADHQHVDALKIAVLAPMPRPSESTATAVHPCVRRSLYQRFGVLEYWVFDPELNLVRVDHVADRFARPQELSREAADVLTTPLVPELELALDAIFKE
jgi:hypothetical protein